MITHNHHFWIDHAVRLTSALLRSSALERLYTPDEIAYLEWLHEAERRASIALQAGEEMDVHTAIVADYLTAYADAHIAYWHPHTTAQFDEAMQEARACLNRDLRQGRRLSA